MIRIKDYILNENEIVKIQVDDSTKEMEIDHKYGRTFIDATFDDIEWDYKGNEKNEDARSKQDLIFQTNSLQSSLSDKLVRIKELEEENKSLKAEVDLLNNTRHFMNNKIGKQ